MCRTTTTTKNPNDTASELYDLPETHFDEYFDLSDAEI